MKAFLKFLLLPFLLLVGMAGAYSRGDFFAFCALGGAFALWLLLTSLGRFSRKASMPAAADKSVNTDSQIAKNQLNDRVHWVASAFASDLSVLRIRAKTVATELGPNSIDQLASLFHSEHSPPPELKASFEALGHWITARHFAIFEVFYHLGRPSIPTLKRVAFGTYDWTQGNAIEILCRLAADDVNREDIVAELIANLPSLREEAHCYALSPLLAEAEKNHALQEIIERLLLVPEFRESCEHILAPLREA